MATNTFDDLLNQAKEAEQTLRSTLTGFTAERQPHLSDLGRKQFQDQAKDLYARTVADLRTRYRAALESESAKTGKALEAARTADFERRRALLGDVAMLHVTERRLATMDGEQLRSALTEAAPGFERAWVQELGSVVISERLAAGEKSTQLYMAAQEYRAPVAPELAAARQRERDLVVAAERESQLDVVAWKNDTAVRLGVKAEYMEMPNG
jgi:hypothetical protein